LFDSGADLSLFEAVAAFLTSVVANVPEAFPQSRHFIDTVVQATRLSMRGNPLLQLHVAQVFKKI
jgi:hypothetical protein